MCFFEFLNFQKSFFHKLTWFFPVEINYFKVINIVRKMLCRTAYLDAIALYFEQVTNCVLTPISQKLDNPSPT